ncbi:MAG: hypothetical protein R3B99_07280 [Polyangiales bacterium]
MFSTGFWTIGRYRGIPIRLHWSIPLGALFGRFAFVPGSGGLRRSCWCTSSATRSSRSDDGSGVREVQVHGLGGVCIHQRGAP